jgi:hypothetical protein
VPIKKNTRKFLPPNWMQTNTPVSQLDDKPAQTRREMLLLWKEERDKRKR